MRVIFQSASISRLLPLLPGGAASFISGLTPEDYELMACLQVAYSEVSYIERLNSASEVYTAEEVRALKENVPFVALALADRRRPFLVTKSYAQEFGSELAGKDAGQPPPYHDLHCDIIGEVIINEVSAAYVLGRFAEEMRLCDAVLERYVVKTATGGAAKYFFDDTYRNTRRLYQGLEKARLMCECRVCQLIPSRPAPYARLHFLAAFGACRKPDYWVLPEREFEPAIDSAVKNMAALRADLRPVETEFRRLMRAQLKLTEDVKAGADEAALCYHAGDYEKCDHVTQGLQPLIRDLSEGETAIRSLLGGDLADTVWGAYVKYVEALPVRTERLLNGAVLGGYLGQFGS